MSCEKISFVHLEPADVRDYTNDDVLCEISPPNHSKIHGPHYF